MRRTLQCLSALALCGIGFAAGRLTLTRGAPGAMAADPELLRSSLLIQPPADADAGMGAEEAAAMERMMAAGTPGPNHDALKSLEGEWTGFVRITMAPGQEPMQMPTTIKREWIMGGRYMKETITSDTEMGAFEGMAIIGYNNTDGVYESVWIDNMSTSLMMDTGAYDKAKQLFRFYGAHRDPGSGRVVMVNSELDLSNPDRHVMTGHQIGPDGSPYQHFYGVFERVK